VPHQELAEKALNRRRASTQKPVSVFSGFSQSFRRVFRVFAVGFCSFRKLFPHANPSHYSGECRGKGRIMQKLEKLLYTTAEARAVIGCGTTRLYELLAAGKLRARRLGHRTMIEAESLHLLVNSLPRVATPTMQRRASGGPEMVIPPAPRRSKSRKLQCAPAAVTP
jgi:hypothetical protein